MKKFVKLIALVLCLAFCITLAPIGMMDINAAAANTTHIYMVMTNPGEDCNTQMRIGWHSDFAYTGCYVEYTTADDTEFAKAIRADGSYDDTAYLWFYNRLKTDAMSANRFTTKFLDWSVELEGLTPDTDYIYRVCDGEGLYTKTYNFKTAGADEYSIIWMSDAHVRKGYDIRRMNWRKMVTFAEQQAKYPVGFQFTTGDSVTCGDRYEDWLAIANESFTQKYMIANTIGNHDVYDGIMIKDTAYTQYWKGGQYFQIAHNNPNNGYTHTSTRINGYLTNDGYTQYADKSANELFTVTEGALSGKLISGAQQNMDGRAYWFNYNGLLFIIFDYYELMFREDTEAALEWASQVIEDNYGKYDYIICADHVNLINGGGGDFRDYGANDYAYFQPFFDKYNVDLFLAGDNHVYVRTSPIYNYQKSSDPNKGTTIIQAPCLSRPQASVTAYDASGYADKQYSVAGSTVGGLVIDVDENGLTFRCLVYEANRAESQYYEYDSYTVARRSRPAAAKVGYYDMGNESFQMGTAPGEGYLDWLIPIDDGNVPTNTVYVEDTYLNYGLINFDNTAYWADVSGFTYICGDNRENAIATIDFKTGLTSLAEADGIYTASEFNALIADKDAAALKTALGDKAIYKGSKHTHFTDQYTLTKVFDSSSEAVPVIAENDTVFVTSIDVQSKITYDAINDTYYYCTKANDNSFSETVPEGIIVAEGAGLTIAEGEATLNGIVYVKDLEKAVLNASIVVTDKDGATLNYYEVLPEGANVTVYNGGTTDPVGSFKVKALTTFTVTFTDSEGKVISTVTVNSGEDATPPTAPAKENYTFVGWDKAFTKVTKDITAKAMYKLNTYTVTFADYDGKVISTATVEHGAAAKAPADPKRENYTFTGWDKAFDAITADITVTATYKANVLLGDANGDGKINSLDAAMILRYDAEITDLTAEQLLAADVTGDGKVNSLDAAKILRYDADIIKEL